ncbi:ABC transporter substrate-binding protein (plasmid) [Roseomonas sp. OT10]|uniref:ABC transporter substrate-binding protein n=1 Tax=Roseomonas cutis TaxID=2897332 RepID=UPI001E4F46C8|nr:ABC transporter substrate-binding protein [Roseomonas sp. OT10]UFN51529.1 ABC transporter substrate-binding protein [Roseomonas sp. OT10]
MNVFTSGRLAGLATLVVMALAAGAAHAQSSLQVSVVLPLTGNGAFLGQGQQRTLQVLQEQVNKEGGIGGRPLEFVFRDDQTSPQVAVQLTSAVAAQRPPVMLGSSIVAMCNAMAPLVRNGPVTYCLSPAVQPPAGSYMYSSSVSTHDLLAADIRYFRARGWTRVALISSTDATGQDFQNGISAALKMPENAGIEVVENARFNQTDVSVSAQMERIRAANPQVLVAWTTGGPIATIFKGIVQAGLNIPVVTTNGNQIFEQMDQYAEFLPRELYFATSLFLPHEGRPSYAPEVEQAQQRFYTAMNAAKVAIDIRAGLSWDAGNLMVDALRKLGPSATAAQVKEYMEGLTDWAGISGVYNFRQSPSRGLGPANAIITRWDPAARLWAVVSSAGGGPLPQ